MSDITIRLDGLLLGLLILAGMALFAAITLLSALRTVLTTAPGDRSWKVTTLGLWLVLIHAIALIPLFFYMDGSGTRTGCSR